jgi:hypothetical protein
MAIFWSSRNMVMVVVKPLSLYRREEKVVEGLIVLRN